MGDLRFVFDKFIETYAQCVRLGKRKDCLKYKSKTYNIYQKLQDNASGKLFIYEEIIRANRLEHMFPALREMAIKHANGETIQWYYFPNKKDGEIDD